jgi:hypothetical protein
MALSQASLACLLAVFRNELAYLVGLCEAVEISSLEGFLGFSVFGKCEDNSGQDSALPFKLLDGGGKAWFNQDF